MTCFRPFLLGRFDNGTAKTLLHFAKQNTIFFVLHALPSLVVCFAILFYVDGTRTDHSKRKTSLAVTVLAVGSAQPSCYTPRCALNTNGLKWRSGAWTSSYWSSDLTFLPPSWHLWARRLRSIRRRARRGVNKPSVERFGRSAGRRDSCIGRVGRIAIAKRASEPRRTLRAPPLLPVGGLKSRPQ